MDGFKRGLSAFVCLTGGHYAMFVAGAVNGGSAQCCQLQDSCENLLEV